jgi:hypothetical protein
MTDFIETNNEQELRSLIFNTDDREEMLVEVPQWKTKILLKAATGTKRAELIALVDRPQNADYYKDLYFELVLAGCVHPTTKRPIFKPADRDTLMSQKNGAVLQLLAEMIQQLSHIDGTVSNLAKKNLQNTENSTATTNWQSLQEPKK